MKKLLFLIPLIALAACKEDIVQDVTPIALTEEAVGHFCQMNILEHEGPKAQAHLEGLPGTPLFFSQVRDAVAFLRMPEQNFEILTIWVSDMGAQGATWGNPGASNWIDAQEAYFVVGAKIEGGMGAPEVVPFSTEAEASFFATANGGAVMRLDSIPDADVLAPVALAADDGDDDDFANRLNALSISRE